LVRLARLDRKALESHDVARRLISIGVLPAVLPYLRVCVDRLKVGDDGEIKVVASHGAASLVAADEADAMRVRAMSHHAGLSERALRKAVADERLDAIQLERTACDLTGEMALWGRHYVAQLYDSNLVVPIREMALRGSRGDVQNAAQLALAAIVNRAGPLHLRYLVQHRLVQAFAVVIGMPHRSTEVLTYTLKAVRRVMSQPLLRRAAWHNFCDPPGRGDDALGRLYADEKCDEQVRKSATACLDQYGGLGASGTGDVPADVTRGATEDAVVEDLAEINQVLGDADDGRIRAAAAISSATANANGGFGGGGGGASKPDPESKQRWEGLFGVPYLGDQMNGGGGGESKNERDGGQRSSPTGGGGGGDGDEEEDDDDENDEEYAEEDDRDYEGDPRDEEHLSAVGTFVTILLLLLLLLLLAIFLLLCSALFFSVFVDALVLVVVAAAAARYVTEYAAHRGTAGWLGRVRRFRPPGAQRRWRRPRCRRAPPRLPPISRRAAAATAAAADGHRAVVALGAVGLSVAAHGISAAATTVAVAIGIFVWGRGTLGPVRIGDIDASVSRTATVVFFVARGGNFFLPRNTSQPTDCGAGLAVAVADSRSRTASPRPHNRKSQKKFSSSSSSSSSSIRASCLHFFVLSAATRGKRSRPGAVGVVL
jgi:hypothetical protein